MRVTVIIYIRHGTRGISGGDQSSSSLSIRYWEEWFLLGARLISVE